MTDSPNMAEPDHATFAGILAFGFDFLFLFRVRFPWRRGEDINKYV